MKKHKGRWLWLGCVCCLLVVLGCTGCLDRRNEADAADRRRTPAEIFASEETPERKIEQLLQRLSKEEKLGQLLMIGIHGKALDADSSFMLQQYHAGGVILFDRNLETVAQTKQLTADLQRVSRLPLLIALDEEGGMVARGRELLEAPPAQLELGEAGRPEAAAQWARLTGERLLALGINVNFAPVADLGSFSTRHYSKEAAVVSRFVQAAAAGYEQAGITFALKHFPGIGKGERDTHQGECVVDISREEQRAEDLRPFREVIGAYANDGFMIMVTHAVFPQLTGQAPASLSPAVGELLRQELGFKGVIITDDLEMGGAAVGTFRELGVRALQAGADIVLVCHEYEHEQEVYLGLLEALEKGELTEQRVDESLRRVLQAKLKYAKAGK